ncbi:MAG: hypothetical protein HUJ94_01465, partial [Bacteroidales bacterium]|nr:hypothetical protein [Bacteroidales bacterium]
MTHEQLHAMAEELGLKSYKRLSDENLIYRILDETAVTRSQQPEPEKPKRGRPRKDAQKQAKPEVKKQEESRDTPATQLKLAQEPSQTPVQSAPAARTDQKKQGRPAKQKADKPQASAEKQTSEQDASQATPAAENQPKKRGRKPKQAPKAEEQVQKP